MFSLKIRTVYNIISRAKKEGRLGLKESKRTPKMMSQRVERKIIKTERISSSNEKRQGYVFPMKPSEMFLKNINILQEWLGKKLLLSAQNRKILILFNTQITENSCSRIGLVYSNDKNFNCDKIDEFQMSDHCTSCTC